MNVMYLLKYTTHITVAQIYANHVHVDVRHIRQHSLAGSLQPEGEVQRKVLDS